MFKYTNKGLSNEICTTLHTFPADFQVSVSKLLFDFVDILERGFFTEGILDFYFNDSEIQKSENTVNMFLGIKCYRNQSEWYILVYKSAAEVEKKLILKKKHHFEKTYCNWNLQMQTDKVQ